MRAERGSDADDSLFAFKLLPPIGLIIGGGGGGGTIAGGGGGGGGGGV